MFTDAGNFKIDSVVSVAKIAQLSWPEVHNLLVILSKQEEYAEATDTAVREIVYKTLGFDTPFSV